MKKTILFVFFYAACVLIGGAVGYFYAGSLPSLVLGVTFGSLLFLSSFFMYKKKTFANWMTLSLSILLEGVFIWRFAKTLRFFPSGFLSALSLVVIVIVALKIGRQMREAR